MSVAGTREEIQPPKKGTTVRDHQIGTRIATLRGVAGLSQAELGRVLGISFQQVQKYEKGKNRVGAGRLHAIADALGVSVASFFGEDAQMPDGVAEADLPGARDLLRSYAAIRDPEVRQQILALVRSAARLNAIRPAT